jgi:hypothetical protein
MTVSDWCYTALIAFGLLIDHFSWRRFCVVLSATRLRRESGCGACG